MSKKEDKKTQEKIANYPTIFKPITDMYNRQVEKLNKKHKRNLKIVGGLGVGVGAFSPKIYIGIKFLISLFT